MTNEQLADALEVLPESQFRNYVVYDVLPDEHFERNIDTVNEFDWK